jgi:outer membrane autotransporter protein
VAQTCAPVPNGGQLGGPLGTSTTCSGFFNTNINFTGVTTPPTAPQTVTLSDAQVLIPAGSPPDAVNIDNSAGGAIATLGSSAALTANNSSIDNTANSGAGSASGLRIQTNGNATITASNTPIAVLGAGNTNGIWSIVLPSSDPNTAAKVSYTGPGITVTGGANSTAIQAENRGNGNASIDAAGNFTVAKPNDPGFFVFGLLAKSGAAGGIGSDASVNYSSGTIDVRGVVPVGIQASSRGDGSATVITAAGTKINVSDTQLGGEGVLLLSSGTAASGKALTANVASTIMSSGPASIDPNNFPSGIVAFGFRDAPIFVTLTKDGSITTQGGNGAGIYALSAGGTITINSSGPINTTDGSNAIGIFADNTFGTSGRNNKLVTDPGTPIIGPQAAQATVTVNATDVLTMGQFGTAISATAGGNVAVNVAPGGSVMGGWQADLTSVGEVSLLPAAGVILNSTGGVATLTNDGSIGALSDRAIVGDPVVINNGLITGFVQFTGGDNSIINNGTFNLRHFADTAGTGRDTVRVAIADLGGGFNNSFNNIGTLALLGAPGATKLDATGQYLPLGNPNNAMALNGPVQGHLVGVATFTNSGIIDLQSNPVAGDVLVITGSRQAGLGPSQVGPGTFISNGGVLRLDTVLNEGGAATRSDTLVVDGTAVGAGGPTSIAIRSGGGGALTVGDGILLVEANPILSASGAFSLQGASITAGAFDYFLFKGGATPRSQGNWYLRNTLIAPTPGVPPPEAAPGTPPLPTLAPGAAPIPLFQPGVAVMSVVPSIARSLGLLTLGTFNERQGDQLLVRGGCSRETQDRIWNADKRRDENCNTKIGAWGRVFGQNTREHFAQGARPDFDGTFAGFQAGADLWRLESIYGHHDNIGFYVAQARASGSVHGLVDAREGALAGHVDLDASSYGGYWTHLGPSNWYIDTVVQGTHFFGTPQSIRGVSTTVNGDAFTGSIEAGYPIHLAPWLSFEPQIQGIWQRVWLYDTLVPVSTITFDRADVFTGRAGALLRGTFGSTGAVWQPYLKGNVWWGSNGFDTVYFNSFGIPTGRNGGTTLEGGGGITGKLTRNISVYGDASYLTSVSGESHIALKGNVGLRVTW